MPNGVEEDVDEEQRPPVVAPPNVTAPAPSTTPVSTTPWSTIETAAGQLRAGQPVTALPKQAWSPADWAGWQQRQAAYEGRVAGAQADQESQRQMAEFTQMAARTKDAAKTIEAAVRFQNLRRYGNLIASGMPPEKALAQVGPGLFFSHESALGPALKAMTPPAAPFVPVPLNFPGMSPAIRTGRYGEQVRFAPQPKPAVEGKLSDKEKADLHNLERRQATIEKEMASQSWEAQAELPEFKAKQAATVAELADIKQRLNAYRPEGAAKAASPAAPAGNRMKVIGPKGQRGTLPEGTTLPPGWKRAS